MLGRGSHRCGAGSFVGKRVKNQEATYRNQAAQRVLSVLDSFSGRMEPVSPSELGNALGMSKNMIHRALALLEEEGLICRSAATNTYLLGPRILTFAVSSDDLADDINVICRPSMERMAELTGESVFLGIIVGRNRVVIDKIEGTGRRVAHSQRGLAVPLHVSKASRVLLAQLTDEEIIAYLKEARPLAEYTDLFADSATETTEDIWEDLRAIRAQGYIAWVGQQQYGGSYIAFPVLDGEHRPHAVMSLGGPAERFPPEQIERLKPELLEIMDKLQARTRLVPAAPIFLGPART